VNDAAFKYRGRTVSEADLNFVRDLIAAHPGTSRRKLSALLCDAWGWVQPNGQRKDMICRGLMLGLHRAGLITLPPVRVSPPNNVIRRRSAEPVLIDATPIETSLSQLLPLEFRQVRKTKEERLFNGLLEAHHYLGYTRPVGEHLKYLVFAKDRPIACVAWSGSALHILPRDRFIGWSLEARRSKLHLLAYNTRFLILPWVKVPHLASHILGRMARLVPLDFNRVYGHPIVYLETYVDPGRFKGTCYRAANWVALGLTTGRGKDAPRGRPRRAVKEILGYPLTARFREILSSVG
jgi:hypothetical protein